jgi:hypothetical protein
VTIDVQSATIDDKPVIRNLLALYLYEFTEFDGRDVDEHALFGYRWLDHYWAELDRYPFLVRVDGRFAGFVLVHAEAIQDDPPRMVYKFGSPPGRTG